MAREITAHELDQMLPEDRERHLRHKRQRELDKINVHDVARQSLTVTLDGVVMVQGRGTATAQEVASALQRFPVLSRMLDAVTAAKRSGHVA